MLVLLLALNAPVGGALAAAAVTDSTILIGGVMDLEGDSKGLGRAMKAGVEAAVQGAEVGGRKIEFIVANDFYDPEHTIEKTLELIDRGVFVMLGNVGTPTAKASLPLLARSKVPAVGFFTGADLLRPGIGEVINFRASYMQEITSTIDAALRAGVTPSEICAYVQNDAYGMAGVEGIKRALQDRPGTRDMSALLDRIIALEGPDPARNGIGPVGFYTRNTLTSREGYASLASCCENCRSVRESSCWSWCRHWC